MLARIMLVVLVAGGAFFCGSDAFPQPRPLFTQHERQSHAAARPNSLCKPEPYEAPITYSEVSVFDTREVVYQISTVVPCLGQVGDPPFALRWEAPRGTAVVFRSRLSTPEFEQLKICLDRADVQGIQRARVLGQSVTPP